MTTKNAETMIPKVRKIIPPMLEKFHKGQLGRVAVIGGSADFTGAPYFSAMASARLGCDMSHVLCEPSASPVIKSYSPNLMVHPILPSSNTNSEKSPDIPKISKPIEDFLPRLHVLVIGPGLGRDPVTQAVIKHTIQLAKSKNIPFVLDADGLLLVNEEPDLISGYKECILTPNVVEFGRLAKAVGIDPKEGKEEEVCGKVSKKLGGVCIIQKGKNDYISNASSATLISDIQGGLKRSGGQGDTLTGSLGTLLGWRAAYHDGLWETGEKERMSREETLLLAAWGGSAVTRECSRRAFEKRGRSLQASDLTDEVHGSFMSLFGEPEGDAKL